MSDFSSKGLSVLVKSPLVQGDDFIGNFSKEVRAYSHTINSNGGFTSANITIPGNNDFVENWIQYGLGRHIEVYGPGGQIIWEGFVNEVTGNLGSAVFTRGPLMDIANRVVVWYTPKLHCLELGDPAYDPDCKEGESTGTQFPTIIAEDFDSQEKYGILEKVVNIGEAYTEDAEMIRDLYLVENANPIWKPSLSIADNSGEMSIQVNCRGYYDWLSQFVFNDYGDTFEFVSTIIKDIITADPNDIFSSDYSRIEENLVIALKYFVDDKLAKTLLDDILAFGGGNDDRWTFGVYKDRKVFYQPIPEEVEYIYYKTGKIQQVEKLSGEIVEPWDVLPCKWVGIPTMLTSFPFNISSPRTDPRIFFGEEVTYTAPDKIEITGARISKLNQLMAKLGLGGA